jgi:hypothetical protein
MSGAPSVNAWTTADFERLVASIQRPATAASAWLNTNKPCK